MRLHKKADIVTNSRRNEAHEYLQKAQPVYPEQRGEQGTLMLVEPEALMSSSFLCNSSTLIPYQSAPAPLPLHALQKRGKATNIYNTLQHAGSLPRDFPFVVLLNS